MVNVLPRSHQKKLHRQYYARLVVVTSVLLAGACFLGSLFLLPPYLLAREQADSAERFRTAVAGTIDLKENTDLEKEARQLQEALVIAENFEQSALFEKIFSDVFALDRKGIALVHISYTRTNTGAVVVLEGVANSRASLLAFAEALRNEKNFTNVQLPISQLVSEKENPFSLKLDYILK